MLCIYLVELEGRDGYSRAEEIEGLSELIIARKGRKRRREGRGREGLGGSLRGLERADSSLCCTNAPILLIHLAAIVDLPGYSLQRSRMALADQSPIPPNHPPSHYYFYNVPSFAHNLYL